MRYAEIIEAAHKLRNYADGVEARKRARDQIAAADRKRADAARKFRSDVDRAHDAAQQAKADLRQSCKMENACAAGADAALGERAVSQLRDKNGVLLGTLHPVGRILQAKDRHGSIVGWYDPRTNQTRDRTGSIVGSGDLLAAMIICRRP